MELELYWDWLNLHCMLSTRMRPQYEWNGLEKQMSQSWGLEWKQSLLTLHVIIITITMVRLALQLQSNNLALSYQIQHFLTIPMEAIEYASFSLAPVHLK